MKIYNIFLFVFTFMFLQTTIADVCDDRLLGDC